MVKKAVLKNIDYFIPKNVMTNDDLSKLMDTSDSWIQERTGIKERHFADDSESTSSLALKAIENLKKNTPNALDDIDCIIFATLSPDYFFPGVAPTIQHKLNLPHIPAYDIRLQCSAFVYGVQMIDAFIKAGTFKKILFVTSDIQNRFLDMTTRGRGMSILFGDAAACMIFSSEDSQELPSGKNNISGVIDNMTYSDGSGTEHLLLRAPGTANPGYISNKDIDEGRIYPEMNGRFVFKNAVLKMCDVSLKILERNGLKSSDLALVTPHQANLRISRAIQERLELPDDKIFNNIQKYGNTTSATIPLCIKEAMNEGRLKKGDLLLALAFGAGFTWGASLIRL